MYQFTYSLNDDDYIEFNRYHLFNAPENKWNILMLRLMVPVLLLLVFILSVMNKDGGASPMFTLLGSVIFSVAWLLILNPLLSLSIKLQVRKMKKTGKLPYGKNTTIQFLDDCVVDESDGVETKIKYSTIEKTVESTSAIYVYFSTIQDLIVPLSVFMTIEEKDAFLSFIDRQVAISKGSPPHEA